MHFRLLKGAYKFILRNILAFSAKNNLSKDASSDKTKFTSHKFVNHNCSAKKSNLLQI